MTEQQAEELNRFRAMIQTGRERQEIVERVLADPQGLVEALDVDESKYRATLEAIAEMEHSEKCLGHAGCVCPVGVAREAVKEGGK